MEEFSNMYLHDVTAARWRSIGSRDVEGTEKLSKFFEKCNPFPKIKSIMSIYSLVVGDSWINDHRKYEIEKESAKVLRSAKILGAPTFKE